jgi:hypothetical protein
MVAMRQVMGSGHKGFGVVGILHRNTPIEDITRGMSHTPPIFFIKMPGEPLTGGD